MTTPWQYFSQITLTCNQITTRPNYFFPSSLINLPFGCTGRIKHLCVNYCALLIRDGQATSLILTASTASACMHAHFPPSPAVQTEQSVCSQDQPQCWSARLLTGTRFNISTLAMTTMAAIVSTSCRQNVCRVQKDFTGYVDRGLLCQDYSVEITCTGLADFSKLCSTLRPPFFYLEHHCKTLGHSLRGTQDLLVLLLKPPLAR